MSATRWRSRRGRRPDPPRRIGASTNPFTDEPPRDSRSTNIASRLPRQSAAGARRRTRRRGGIVQEKIATLTGDPGPALPEFDDPPADPVALMTEWLSRASERGVREPLAV